MIFLASHTTPQTATTLPPRTGFGLRWQSAAPTKLYGRGERLQSGVALRFPPHSKIVSPHIGRAALALLGSAALLAQLIAPSASFAAADPADSLRPIVKVVEGGESKARPEDCRATLVGPGVNQPDPFPGYGGFVGWESPIRLKNANPPMLPDTANVLSRARCEAAYLPGPTLPGPDQKLPRQEKGQRKRVPCG